MDKTEQREISGRKHVVRVPHETMQMILNDKEEEGDEGRNTDPLV